MAKDPDMLIDLTAAATEFEAQNMVNVLEAEGIPAKAFTMAGSVLQWEIAMTQPIRVVVRRKDIDRARLALQSVRSDSIDIDWDEFDVGQSPKNEPHRPPSSSQLRHRRSVRIVILLIILVACMSQYGLSVLLAVPILCLVEFTLWARSRQNTSPPPTTNLKI